MKQREDLLMLQEKLLTMINKKERIDKMLKTIQNKTNMLFCILFILICGVAFYWQDLYYYPGGDDIFYKFVLDNPDMDMNAQLLAYPHRMVETWGDIFSSQNVHYICHSGRYIVHIFVQACTSFLSRPSVVLLNSIFFAIIVFALGYLLKGNDIKKGIVIAATSLLAFAPDVINTMFCQIAVAVNYMWVMAMWLIWLIVYEKVQQETAKNSITKDIVLLFFSTFVGALHEGFTIGFGAGVFFNMMLHFKNIKHTEILMLAGGFIGACFVIFSPGNFGTGGAGSLFTGASHLLHDMKTYIPLWVALLTLFVHICVSWKKTFDFVKENILYVTVVIVNLAFAIVVAYTHDRQLFPVSFCLLILTIRLWQTDIIKIPKFVRNGTLFLLVLYSIGIYVPMTQLRKDVFQGHSDVMSQLMNTNSRILISDKHDAAVNRRSSCWIGSKYINIDGLDYFHSFSILKTQDKNPNYLEAIIPLPVERMVREYEKNVDSLGIAHVEKVYVVKSIKEVEPNDICWNIVTTQYNPKRRWDMGIKATYRFKYDDSYYYIFKCGWKILESKSVEIRES